MTRTFLGNIKTMISRAVEAEQKALQIRVLVQGDEEILQEVERRQAFHAHRARTKPSVELHPSAGADSVLHDLQWGRL